MEKVIYFCNKTYFQLEFYANKWKQLNPEYRIELYDDKRCEDFLKTSFGTEYLDVFRYIQDGPIKADFWRICILYRYGGVYSDIDNEPLVSLSSFLEKDIDFLVCSSCWDEMEFNFNPNLIISHKNNPILLNCINWYLNNYRMKKVYRYWDWSIMRAFTDTLYLTPFKTDGLFVLNNLKIQIIKECDGKNKDIYDVHNIYKGIRVFNNRYRSWDTVTHSFKNHHSS